MLIVRNIGSSVAHYYLDGRDPGCWSPAADRLLDLRGPVRTTDLTCVLQGRHPGHGGFLPRFRRRRRSGWDLMFGAPKSVSLLDGSTPGEGSVRAAHMAAVSGVLAYIEGRLVVNDSTGPGGRQPAGGLISARFEHRSNSAGEPHLHTHVLVANLTVGPGGWVAVRNDEWFVNRRCLDALYQLALRQELAARGWKLEWRLRPDGRGDVASVPTAAVRAASSQSRLVAVLGRFGARQQDGAGAGARAGAEAWPRRAIGSGWDPGVEAGAGEGGAGGPGRGPSPVTPPWPAPGGAIPDSRELRTRVTGHLAGRRSDFREEDVIIALAANHPAGGSPEQARAWAGRYCSASLPVPSPTSQPRWTSRLARSADDRLVGLLEELRAGAGPPGAVPALADPVLVLASDPGRTELMAQAEMLDGLQRQWADAGVVARVAAPTDMAATRWRVLAGLAPYRTGARADVIVVDRADRRSSADLLHLAEAARRHSTQLVLVEGGTMPRLGNFASHGLARFAAGGGRVYCPPPALWEPGAEVTPGRGAVLSGRRAAATLLARWGAGNRDELLVGLGLEEVRGLNAAARVMATGVVPGRTGGFAAGDRVVSLRAGDGRPGCGTFGNVTDADPAAGRVAIHWDGPGDPQIYGRAALKGVGYGWAVTSRVAERVGRPVMVLGPDEALGRLRPLVRASIEVTRPEDGRGLGMVR